MLTIEGIYDGQKIQSLKPIPFKTKKKIVILESRREDVDFEEARWQK